MTPEQAEKIINDYGGAVASLPPKQAVLSLSDLPYSKGRIRYAYFVYIETLAEIGALDDNIASALVQTYALLNTRFQEDADTINKLHKQYTSSDEAREELKKYGGMTVGLPSVSDMEELREFIEECLHL